MTDTVADPAVTPTSAQAEVTVSAAVVDAVRAELAERGIAQNAEVVLFDLDPRAGVSVGRLDPTRGTVADSYSDSGLTLAVLDEVIADHLVRVGRVAAPTSRDWHEEVLDLVTRGRERLRESDGTFLMGRDHIRLFRMARRDVAEAGAPLTARAEDLARAAVSGASAPAVVVADRVSAWPGLRDAIARAVPVPVVDVDPSGSITRPPAHGGHAAEPEVPHAIAVSGDVIEPDVGVATPPAEQDDVPTRSDDGFSAPAEMAEMAPSEDGHTHDTHDTPIFESVTQSPPVVATAFGALAPYVAAPDVPRAQPLRDDKQFDELPPVGHDLRTPRNPDAEQPPSGESAPRWTSAHTPTPPVRSGDGEVNVDPMAGYSADTGSAIGAPPHSDVSVAGPQAAGASRRRHGGKRVLAAVALLCAVAVVAVATALAVGHDEASPTVAAPLPQRTTATPEPEFADPAIYAEARQPARRYTTPPPPETTTPSAEEPAPRPRPRPRTPRPPGGVTIPLPGLPPIVLP